MSKRGIPSTPYFALVGADGKLAKAWTGFESAASAQFEQDVLTSAAG
jgi:hypothetical protein